ncbi:uncharacterized protein EAE97_008015 [Botrytis byssoidea]|uniref:O-methyltransferase C-terminal domain-containing protein n=1 Tax=Botrytis byssoidea TaxID=139641 RepID=A0A9P5IFK3_9HELO|nr:uncharacterized protein EAE97_008015 [Botrytis byssoidea]KAF7936649.1 hypothetical protein EAE97_008015 [Botrytis byssoidea]
MANPETQEILKNLSKLLSDTSYGSSPKSQQEAVRLSKALTATIEAPENVAMELAFSTFIPMSARITVDLNLFEHIVKYEPVNVAKLAELSGAEELLLIIYTLLYLHIDYRETKGTNKRVERILRPLASTSFVKEVDEETWGATPITKAMTQKGIAADALHAPRYFLETSHTSPTNPHDGLMQYAHGTKLQSFDYFGTMPGNVLGDFNTFMGNTMGARKYWLDWWPVEERVFEGVEGADNTFLVDVGGGKGHDIMAFKEKFGRREKGVGRLVLQDQPHVLEEIGEESTSITTFSTTGPTTNVSKSSVFLKNAMKPNYSKLIIHEMIVPESGASTYHALLDLTMMAFNGGIERTGKEWRKLPVKAGFEVTGIWVPEVS